MWGLRNIDISPVCLPQSAAVPPKAALLSLLHRVSLPLPVTSTLPGGRFFFPDIKGSASTPFPFTTVLPEVIFLSLDARLPLPDED